MIDVKTIENKELIPIFLKLDNDKRDMQGLIIRGHRELTSSTFLLLKIKDRKKAREYFNMLLDNYITHSDKDEPSYFIKNGKHFVAVHIAFTSTGLKELEIPSKILDTFSREFIEGMTYGVTGPELPDQPCERSTLLGDTGANHPSLWEWGYGEREVDCMVMLYANSPARLRILKDKVYDQIRMGVEEIYQANTTEYDPNNIKEHFGFEDGLSQPILKGFSKSGNEPDDDKMINPGEVILGYKNEYNSYSPSPYVEDASCNYLDKLPGSDRRQDLGKNGTYLVFRQIEQHVERFWKYNYECSRELGVTRIEKAIKLASKMIGRWPEGQPLVRCPHSPHKMDDRRLNKFRYAVEDNDGFKCPFGAHIRRMNPRDQVHAGRSETDSAELTNKHRMLRRGRLYGNPLDEKLDIEKMILSSVASPEHSTENWLPGPPFKPTEIKRGLHFICLVSDIGRQFEFVQNAWSNTSSFAALTNEVDPIIGPTLSPFQNSCREFTVPQQPIRNRYKNIPEFTTVVGGAYFFMPGIKALKYLLRSTEEAVISNDNNNGL